MKFVKGQWYTDGKSYWEYCGQSGNDYLLRKAGSDKMLCCPYIDDLLPASLTPDFNDAKAGDECFSVEEGICKIMHSNIDNLIAAMNKSGGWDAFTKDGRLEPESTHPLLFNSFAQFTAYWAEEGLKMKGEK